MNRGLSLFLALLMLAGSLSACGKKPSKLDPPAEASLEAPADIGPSDADKAHDADAKAGAPAVPGTPAPKKDTLGREKTKKPAGAYPIDYPKSWL